TNRKTDEAFRGHPAAKKPLLWAFRSGTVDSFNSRATAVSPYDAAPVPNERLRNRMKRDLIYWALFLHWLRLPRSVGVGDPAKSDFDLLFIDIVGVEGAAVPCKSCLGFLAPFVGDIFHELKIAGWTAAIFRRASTLTAQKPGILFTGLG